MGDDDNIIVAGEDPIPDDRTSDGNPTCNRCGSELEWRLRMDCRQERVCPACDED